MAEFEFSYKSAIGEDFLSLDGPVIEVEITAPLTLLAYLKDNDLAPFPVVSGLAVIDTGACVSVVDEGVMQTLGIPYLGTLLTHTIHGETESRRYSASVNFPGLELRQVPLTRVPSGLLRARTFYGGDVIMLAGRDLLTSLTITYDGPGSRLVVRT